MENFIFSEDPKQAARRQFWRGVELFLKTCLLVACMAVGVLALSMGTKLSAQELSGIGKRKPFTISGEAGAEASSFLSNPAGFSRPFSYLLNVSLNPAVYGIALPLQFSFGQNGFNFRHPFNLLQICPSYKWIKAYIGRTGMSLSPYGLGGIGFDGAGVELTPDFWPVSVGLMFGRLQKEDVGDSLRPPLFRRLAYGVKVGYTRNKHQWSLHLFHAWENGLKAAIDDGEGGGVVSGGTIVRPQQNLVVAWQGRSVLWNVLTLTSEGGVSVLSDVERRGEAGLRDDSRRRDDVRRRATPGLSFKVAAAAYGAELSYERQGAQFYSMGRFYSGGDLESISLGYSGEAQQKWRFSGHIGYQRDNLNHTRLSRINRLVGDFQLHYASGGAWDGMLSYSNFMTHTRRLPFVVEPGAYVPIEHPDSLRHTQLSQQAQLHVNIRLGGSHTSGGSASGARTSNNPTGGSRATAAQTLSVDFSFQEARTFGEAAMSNYFTAQLAHNLPLDKDRRLNTLWHAQAVYRPAMGQADVYTGPAISLSKRLLPDKSLHLSGRVQYDLSMERGAGGGPQSGVGHNPGSTNGGSSATSSPDNTGGSASGRRSRLTGGLANLGLGASYQFLKRHQLDARLNLRIKHSFSDAISTNANTTPGTAANAASTDDPTRTDFTATLRYTCRF